MEGAREFRDRAREEDVEETKEHESTFAGRLQGAAERFRTRMSGTPEQEEQGEALGHQIRRGQHEATEVGRDVAEVLGELGTLLQREVQLAKAELSQQVGKVVRSAVMGAAAGAFATLMLVFLFTAVMLVLGEVVALWIAAFITTGILLVLAAIGGLFATQQLKRVNLTPEQTMESVKEDLEWARKQMTSSGR